MAVIKLSEQVEQQELVHVPGIPANTINLSKFALLDMWDRGILPPVAFVALALKFEAEDIQNDGSIDIDNFIENWEAIPHGEADHGKRLTEEQLRKALATLAQKEQIAFPDRQLSLTLLM